MTTSSILLITIISGLFWALSVSMKTFATNKQARKQLIPVRDVNRKNKRYRP